MIARIWRGAVRTEDADEYAGYVRDTGLSTTGPHRATQARGSFADRSVTTQPASEVVKFGWEMVASGGEVAAVGLEFVILDADGRIRIDCQFIES